MNDLDREEDLARTRLDRRTLVRMTSLLRPARGAITGAVLIELALLASIFLRPWFIGRAIDGGLIPEAGGGWSVDRGLVALMAGGLFLTWVARFGLAGLNQWLLGSAALRVLGALRERVFAHVQGLSVRYFDQSRAGRIIARADRDVDSVRDALVNGPPELLSMVVRSLGAGVLLWLIDPPLFWRLMPLFPALALAVPLFQKAGAKAWGRIAEMRSRFIAHLCESINGVRVIQQMAHLDANRVRYQGMLRDNDRASVAGAWLWGWFQPYTVVLFTAGMAVLVVAGGDALAAGRLTLGELSQCIFYLFIFLGPLQELGDLFEKIANASASAKRIFLLLDTPAEVVDAPDAVALATARGEVAFEDVRFAYRAGGEPVVDAVTLRVPAGETLAIVGPTGHGKSTLVQLLCRFYDVDAGRVLLDGRDIRGLTQASLRRRISVVLQDNVLFSGSVLDNLRLARPEASDDELSAAVSELGADEVLLRLPDGYRSDVGPAGGNLSHGQRQLVCLVRAYLADPAVLVLDEATSAIDVHTERRLSRALRRLCRGRTAIIIAHRLSTIRDADRIAVVWQGRIAELGAHDELMARGGRYAELYRAYERAQDGG
ncbi:MAG: ABC transporter ATP-binding protein [Planctomycetes bacterium]|nr:ABC transporter ATP-binding protein [Planctomycetota bacterium]